MPDSGDNELRELRQVFVTEAEQHLDVLEEGLVDLEAYPDDGDRLRTVFRSMHTIKGSASLVDLQAIELLAHRAEDILSTLRDGHAPVTSEVVSVLLRALDALRRMVAEVAGGETPDASPYTPLVTELGAWRPDVVADGGNDGGGADADDATGPGASRADAYDVPSGGGPSRAVGTSHLRVDVAKLDRLLEVTTEIVLGRRGFAARLESAEGAHLRPLREAFEDDGRLFDELRDAVVQMRMVAVGPTLRRFARSVRDAARDTGKQVRLVVEGEEVEVDTSIVQRLVDPLTHLVRNAVDHGIESPDARVAAGKGATGTVTLRARRDPASLVIEVADDGAGLSRARVEPCVREHGVADPETLTDAQLWGLLFEPGLSTARRLSELSGRGVGLDAVRRAVEALRGSVEIAPHRVAGTVVTLRMPYTLSMVDGIEVAVGDGTFIVPLENVTACMDAPWTAKADDGLLEYGDEMLPYVRLRRVFASPGAAPAREQMLVVRHAGLSAGLVVDRLLGEAETAVRPLGSGLSSLSPLGGSAVLRDGRIGLLLDVPTLLRELVAGARASGLVPAASRHPN
jgi:two-component system, chemotaxis family, sensor kinase CheA